MSRKMNNRAQKQEDLIPHNRHPGGGKFWKRYRNRYARRHGQRYWNDQVKGWATNGGSVRQND